MKQAILIVALASIVWSADAIPRRPPLTVEELIERKPLVEEAIKKSEKYYNDFLLLPDTPENRTKADRMKAANLKARAWLAEIEVRTAKPRGEK